MMNSVTVRYPTRWKWKETKNNAAYLKLYNKGGVRNGGGVC